MSNQLFIAPEGDIQHARLLSKIASMWAFFPPYKADDGDGIAGLEEGSLAILNYPNTKSLDRIPHVRVIRIERISRTPDFDGGGRVQYSVLWGNTEVGRQRLTASFTTLRKSSQYKPVPLGFFDCVYDDPAPSPEPTANVRSEEEDRHTALLESILEELKKSNENALAVRELLEKVLAQEVEQTGLSHRLSRAWAV